MNHLVPVFALAMILAVIASREHGSFALPQLGRLNESGDAYVLFEILIIIIVAVLVTGAAAMLAPETFAGTFQ